MNIDAELDRIEAIVAEIDTGDSTKDRVAKGFTATDRLTAVTPAITAGGSDAQRERAKELVNRVYGRVFSPLSAQRPA